MRLIALMLCACWTQATAQHLEKIQILDAEYQLPIPGATVEIRKPSTAEKDFAVTDENGFFSTPLDRPFNITIRHVAYQPLKRKISAGEVSINLMPLTGQLSEVVVTGQFEPQSIDRSVHTVKAISRERIEAQGAIDLADVLSNNLNITLTPNKANGRTGVSMLGLDGQYVKILVDGIPFPSIDGNGNNVDITQINMNSIERIEIVEGPMAVNYGANAMAGVINLITKNKPTNSISLQEETVRSEYGLNRGRHIQSVSLGHAFGEKVTVLADFQRNDFQGFQSTFMGEDHAENDGLRGYDWHPKLQHGANASIGYRTDGFRARYRFSYFDQKLDIFNRVVHPDEHPSSGVTNPFSLDDRSETTRLAHTLTLQGRIGKQLTYNVVSSYNGVEAEQMTLRKRILTGVEEEVINSDISLLKSVTSRGTLNNLGWKRFQLELGYEYTYEKIDGATIEEGTQDLDNLAGFASVEWEAAKDLIIRPGLRVMHNTFYPTPLIYSMNVKYKMPFDLDVRLAFGRSYRTPNITELFFFFVDANHNVTGNPDLSPEDGHGISLDLKKNIRLGSLVGFSTLKAFRNDIQDQITLGVVNQNPLQFRYINIEEFKSQGVSFSNRLEWQNISLTAGVSYIGRYNRLVREESSLEDFLYSTEVNINASYAFRKPDIHLALFYKHTGPVFQYILDQETGDFRRGTTNSFNWLDFTTTWNANDHLSLQGGVKNILDIRDVPTTSGVAGAHSEAPNSVGLTYGRSFFLRASYTF